MEENYSYGPPRRNRQPQFRRNRNKPRINQNGNYDNSNCWNHQFSEQQNWYWGDEFNYRQNPQANNYFNSNYDNRNTCKSVRQPEYAGWHNSRTYAPPSPRKEYRPLSYERPKYSGSISCDVEQDPDTAIRKRKMDNPQHITENNVNNIQQPQNMEASTLTTRATNKNNKYTSSQMAFVPENKECDEVADTNANNTVKYSTTFTSKTKLRNDRHSQNRLMEGLKQPVTATKAERMMQMMGWKGGALGSKSNGIEEPITLDLAQTYDSRPTSGRESENDKNKLPIPKMDKTRDFSKIRAKLLGKMAKTPDKTPVLPSFSRRGEMLQRMVDETPELQDFIKKGENNTEILQKETLFIPENSGCDDISNDSSTQNNNSKFVKKVKGKKLKKHERESQIRLIEGLNQPVAASIAERMMQQMGWQGGGLGITGLGIQVPIMINLDYGYGVGLGHVTQQNNKQKPQKKAKVKKEPKKAKVKKESKKNKDNTIEELDEITEKQPKKKKKEKPLKMINVTKYLLEILAFVKDNSKVQHRFPSKIPRYHRKMIHLVIESVRNGELVSLNSVSEMDLLQSIQEANNNVLITESEGVHPNRCLVLSKEAPSHVYLITDADFKEDIVEEPENAEKNDEDNVEDGNVDEITDNIQRESKNSNQNGDNIEIVDLISDNEEDKFKDKTVIDKPVNSEIKVEMNTDIDRETKKAVKDENDTAIDKENKEEQVSKVNENNEIKSAEAKTELDFRKLIIDYFKEFIQDDVYTELRVLGPFDNEQLEVIYELFADVTNLQAKYEEYTLLTESDVLDEISSKKLSLRVTEDCNGYEIIVKVPQDCANNVTS